MAENRNVSIILKMKDEASSVIRSFDKDFQKSFGFSITKTARDAGIVAAAGIAAITAELAAATYAAIQSDKAQAQLANAIRNTGKEVGPVIKHLNDYAGALQRQTGIDDEAINGAQQLLIQLGHLSGEGLDRATKAALDFSVAKGVDLLSAAELLSKAAQGEVVAFTRLGFQYTDTKDKALTYKETLDQIEASMSGSAAAAGATFGGKLTILAGEFENLQEEIGTIITHNPQVLAAFDAIIDAVASLTDWFKKNSTEVNQWVSLTVQDFAVVTAAALKVASVAAAFVSPYSVNAALLSLKTDEASAALIDLAEKMRNLPAPTEDAGNAIRSHLVPPLGEADAKAKALGLSVKGLILDIENAVNSPFFDDPDKSIDTTGAFANVFGSGGASGDAKPSDSPGGQFSNEATDQFLANADAQNEALRQLNDTYTQHQELASAAVGAVEGAWNQLFDQIVAGQINAGQIVKGLVLGLAKEIIGILIKNALAKAVLDKIAVAREAATGAARDGIALTSFYFELLPNLAYLTYGAPAAAAAIAEAAAAGAAAVGAAGTAAGSASGAAASGAVAFAYGGLVGGSGYGDTVPALLTPGEGVLTRSTVANLQDVGIPIGGSAGSVSLTANFIGGGRAMAEEILEEINDMVARKGYTLTASRVLGPA